MSRFKAVIPWERITRIKPVMAEGSEDISAVKRRTGCQYIINFGTYRFSDRELDSGLKLDGEVLKLGYTGFGFGIRDGRLHWSWQGSGYQDWFGQMYSYVKDGVLTVPASRGTGKDGRIGVGITEEALILAGCDKGSGMSARAFMDWAFTGCRYALEGDGSYSAQWITPDSQSGVTREVVWYLCVWTKEDNQERGEDSMIKATCTARTSVYDGTGKLERGRYIAKGDICMVGQTVTGNLLIPVEYPVTGGTRLAYLKSLINFWQA